MPTTHPSPTDRGSRDRILDAAAAYAAVPERPALAQLARHAGVSRPTVYRHFGDSDAVFRALWEREVGALLGDLPLEFSTLEELAARIVEIADQVSRHPVLAPTFRTDPGLVARYVLDRLGSSQRLVFDRLLVAIETAQSRGLVREGSVTELAAMVMLVVQSAVQSRSMIAEFLTGDAWARELGHAVRGYLAP